MNHSSAISGPKARAMTAWAGASPSSAGPGEVLVDLSGGLKGLNKIRATNVPPLQGGGVCSGTITWGFTPGCHITGFQPGPPRRIVAELDVLQAEVDALKGLQAETATELDALLPAILDKAFKGEF